jgi:D-mannonate dehydratase
MVEDGEFLTQQKEILPELYKDLFHKDEKGKIWMPSAINLHEKGMIFANGASAFDWHWSAVKSVPVKEEEKHKYPNPKKPGEHYKFRMDMDTIKNFSEKEFMDALSYIGVIPE